MALTMTYFPKTEIGYCTFFGCTAKTERRDGSYNAIISMLQNLMLSSGAIHPFIIPMVFFEVERRRLFDAAEDEGRFLNNEILRIGDDTSATTWLNNDGKIRDTINRFQKASRIQNEIEAFRTELSKGLDHTDALASVISGPSAADVGARIAGMLRETINEAGSWSRYSKTVLDSTLLRTQMVCGTGGWGEKSVLT